MPTSEHQIHSPVRDNVVLNNFAHYPAIEGKAAEIRYGVVENENHYGQVLALRLKAYQAAGKISPHAKARDMADVFDSRSRIFIALVGDNVVGSVRLIYHGDDDELSYGRYFTKAPPSLPPKADYLEASRMCVDPEFWGTEISIRLVDCVKAAARVSGRRYIVGGAAGRLIGYWQRQGFVPFGIKYQSIDFAGLEHEIVVYDTRGNVN